MSESSIVCISMIPLVSPQSLLSGCLQSCLYRFTQVAPGLDQSSVLFLLGFSSLCYTDNHKSKALHLSLVLVLSVGTCNNY